MLVFIGSSREAVTKKPSPVTQVESWVRACGHIPIRWDDAGVFPPGCFVISRLLELSLDVDAAIFIYGSDDEVWYRGDLTKQPRDNVLIELGAFSHALGTDRTIVCRTKKTRMASDLHGLVFLNLDHAKAKVEFNSWLQLINSTPKASYVVDEHSSLRQALSDIVWDISSKLKNKKITKTVALFEIVNEIILSQDFVGFTFVSARRLMELVERKYPEQVEEVYWWLIVYGAFRFRDIEQFFDESDHWTDSVDYAVISERGKAFFMHLQRRNQLIQLSSQSTAANV